MARSNAGRQVGAASSEYAVRLRVAHLLDLAQLEPAGQPASAILIVRRLADPLPRRLAPALDAIRPSPEWERAAQSALADCFDRAARPAYGPVPPSANAVRFDDEAELMACLAHDLVAGDAPARWWWQAFFRDPSRDALALVVSAWLERPRAIAAAFGRLASTGDGVRFVSMLSPPQVRALFVATADAYDLPSLVSTPSAAPAVVAAPRGSAPINAPRSAAAGPSDRAEENQAAGLAESPPWHALIQPASVPHTLGLEQQTLLGVALAIWRAPLAVRTRAFQQAFHAWRRRAQDDAAPSPRSVPGPKRSLAEPDDVPPPPSDASTSGISLAPSSRITPAQEAAPATMSTARQSADSAESPARPDSEEAAATVDRPANSRPRDLEPHARADRIHEPDSIVPDVASASTPVGDRAAERLPGLTKPRAVSADIARAAPVAPVVADALVRSLVRPRLETVHTELGGVLFLINALERDAAWQRFADADQAVRPIGSWGWLALVAGRLLGDRADVAEDPIWTALAGLDDEGQADDEPAVTMFDRRAAAAAPFLDAFVPELHQRLESALAFEPQSINDGRARLAARVLFRRGRLACTATHVDLQMTMDQVDIAVRLAGLDANPGWVPALGRVITFYFE